MKPTVILADDHPPTRWGVRSALEAGGFTVCAEAATADDAVAAALEHRPDLALLDVHMPGGGIRAAARIAAVEDPPAVVMLTISDEDEHLLAALQAGARGYLLKDTSPDRLPLALAGVLAGEAALPRPLVAKLIGAYRDRDAHRRLPVLRERGVRLTDREAEVLELLADGRSTSAMAAELHVSPVTVRRHISTLLHKLGVETRDEAADLARGRV